MFKSIISKKIYLFIVTIVTIVGCGSESTSTSTSTSMSDTTNSDNLNFIYPVKTETPLNVVNVSPEEENILNNISQNPQALLDAINKERASTHTCGDRGIFKPTHALVWNAQLHAAALEHALDLSITNTFSHDGSGTASDITGNGKPSKFYERIVRNGYSNYYSVGENMAGGQETLEKVMKAWMASPGHCENIMKPTYTEVGVAIVKNSNNAYPIYWVQNFGSKRR